MRKKDKRFRSPENMHKQPASCFFEADQSAEAIPASWRGISFKSGTKMKQAIIDLTAAVKELAAAIK